MDLPNGSRPDRAAAAGPSPRPLSLAAEHDWAAAADVLVPALRPAGTRGRDAATVTFAVAAAGDTKPLVDEGPCGLVVVYVIPADGYDVLVSGDHLAAWGMPVAEVRAAAMRNLARWSAGAPWIDETDGDRRIRSSAGGGGPDAARILLPEVRTALREAVGGSGRRVLVGLPERNLLLAGAAPGDVEFEDLFAQFVAACAADADEPIDARTFELRESGLVPVGSIAPA